MLKFRHLQTLTALREHGSLAAASEELSLTPSALSHQLKEVESYYGANLVDRSSRPLGLTPAGKLVLELADRVLPEIARTRTAINRLSHGQAGRLRIASECRSCFDWLTPVLNLYRKSFPDAVIDFADALSAKPHEQLTDKHIDLLITHNKTKHPELSYTPIFEHSYRLVLAPTHDLAKKPIIEAADLAGEVIITYPDDTPQANIVDQLLTWAGVSPKLRHTELTAMLIQLVASEQGVSPLPDWVAEEYENKGWVISKPLDGIHNHQLYAAFRQSDKEKVFMASFLELLEKTRSPMR